MLLFLGLLALTAWLLLVVVRGPERWHRAVVSNLRPDAAEPTRSGYALLYWRHLALLVVAASTTYAVARADVWPRDETLHDAAVTAVDLVPPDELSAARVEGEIRALVGPDVQVDDVSRWFPEPEDEDAGYRTTTIHLQLRWRSWVERFGDRILDEPQPDDAAACVVLTTRSVPLADVADEITASADEGPCLTDDP